MTPDETGKLLAFIGELDGRRLTPETIIAWHQVLADIDVDDAFEAVKKHHRESTDWVKPGHVVYLARGVRDARLQREAREKGLRELEARRRRRTGMPEEVRRRIRDLFKRPGEV
ncbi:hypothetical protein [Sediminivirga luteola]|uniref:Replicative helicase inhibitor G39P N-terminal domain-containing protein n=1 Tax=Sediminivirga luteola TaxID=1774748 RepID=A0A8J2XKL2_9MICO|nr:hypothetical protein [Sediminivirga luteola]GGA10892.1 hypothetical protein GCM10011333_12150 [Sediminivirga luteola]